MLFLNLNILKRFVRSVNDIGITIFLVFIFFGYNISFCAPENSSGAGASASGSGASASGLSSTGVDAPVPVIVWVALGIAAAAMGLIILLQITKPKDGEITDSQSISATNDSSQKNISKNESDIIGGSDSNGGE